MKTLTTTYRQLPSITSATGHLGSVTAINQKGRFRLDYFIDSEPKFFVNNVRSPVITVRLYAFLSKTAKTLGWI